MRMVKNSQDIIGEQGIRNDASALAVNDEDKKIARKSCQKKFLNTEFAWDRSLSQVDIVRNAPRLTDRDMV